MGMIFDVTQKPIFRQTRTNDNFDKNVSPNFQIRRRESELSGCSDDDVSARTSVYFLGENQQQGGKIIEYTLEDEISAE